MTCALVDNLSRSPWLGVNISLLQTNLFLGYLFLKKTKTGLVRWCYHVRLISYDLSSGSCRSPIRGKFNPRINRGLPKRCCSLLVMGYLFKQLSLLGTYITYLVAPKGLVSNIHFKYTFISFIESFTATNEPNKLTFSSQLSWYWALTILAEAMGSNPVRLTNLVSRVCLVTGYKRRGGEWYLEKCGSRKILAGSQNLESVFDKSQSLVFSWFVVTLFESRNFLWRSLGLGFLTRILASPRVSGFTIRHPEEKPWQRGCQN